MWFSSFRIEEAAMVLKRGERYGSWYEAGSCGLSWYWEDVQDATMDCRLMVEMPAK